MQYYEIDTARGRYGHIVTEAVAQRDSAGGDVLMMPVEDDQRHALAGCSIKFYGAGLEVSNNLPRRDPGACVYVPSGGFIYWAARVRNVKAGGQVDLRLALNTTGVMACQHAGLVHIGDTQHHLEPRGARWVGNRCEITPGGAMIADFDLNGRGAPGTFVDMLAISFSKNGVWWRHATA